MADNGELIKRIGLENVVMAESELSFIDGRKPELIYRGYDIKDLAEHSSFEETTYLLWNGELPTKDELDNFRDQLTSQRALPDTVLGLIEDTTEDAVPMEVLRTAVSALPVYADESGSHTKHGRSILAKIPTIVAAFNRVRNGHDPIEPREDLGHAANFLYMMSGDEPKEEHADVFDTCLLLHADHGMNASTFTARVIASTQSDMFSAITGAISALKGPLHGGANQDVVRMLLDIEDPDRPVDHVKEMLDEGKRIPGFGHRVYKVKDPRAAILKRISQDISAESEGPNWYRMLDEIEGFMADEKGIAPNVDLYSGSVYYSLGIPVDLFTPIFAMGRISGWVAQVLEQYESRRIIRPRAEYVGDRDLEYVPVGERE
ncbi:MAG: citrate/2-methylcitrate synthase [Halobacteria archaeon]|nr:citrate/2-methylcitrate synthase [Halobacteria archaeon]